MRYFLTIFSILFLPIYVHASDVITCGDAVRVGKEAKLSIHSQAQKRAQKEMEEFIEKKIITPYIDIWGNKSNLESMSGVIEAYWCESNNTPLHSAYYNFYSRNKSVFEI